LVEINRNLLILNLQKAQEVMVKKAPEAQALQIEAHRLINQNNHLENSKNKNKYINFLFHSIKQ
jgi:hypothetical protein